MTPLESALLFLVLALPAFWLVHRQFAKLGDPRYLRQQGVVIVLPEKAIEAHTGEIGEYMGRPIWETVTFKGMCYRFDHVVEARRRERLGPGELFIEPGLVYVVE
jgi:hypothetical protein